MGVKRLDEKTINQIAAGEVVERPVSVVKELLENSLDAGATQIKISVIDGGKKKISVRDNGSGLSKDDALLAWERGTTSKITTISDLENLTTFGFRGEALASIAAVSKIELVTRQSSDSAGIKITLDGGKITDIQEEYQCPYGTLIEVQDLFWNVPARREFLKSSVTEFAHIHDIVCKISLAFPHTRIGLSRDGSQIFQSPGTKRIDTIVKIYGKEVARNLISFHLSSKELSISGYLSKVITNHKISSHQAQIMLYVNHRLIHDSLLEKAVREAYRVFLPKGDRPLVTLFLDLLPSRLDPNVHPQKKEIRFLDEQLIFDLLHDGIIQRLKEEFPLTPTHRKDGQLQLEAYIASDKQTEIFSDPFKSSDSPNIISTHFSNGKDEVKDVISSDRISTSSTTLEGQLNFLGQVSNTYLVFSCEDGLLLIDQHAAAERVMYDSIMSKSTKHKTNLLSPIRVDLTPEQNAIVIEHMTYFNEIGFAIEHFGGNSYLLKTLPISVIGTKNPPETFLHIVNDILEHRVPKNRVKEAIAITVSCHTSIRAGQQLSDSEVKNLLSGLRNTNLPLTCPHGRPTVILVSRRELEERFKR